MKCITTLAYSIVTTYKVGVYEVDVKVRMPNPKPNWLFMRIVCFLLRNCVLCQQNSIIDILHYDSVFSGDNRGYSSGRASVDYAVDLVNMGSGILQGYQVNVHYSDIGDVSTVSHCVYRSNNA